MIFMKQRGSILIESIVAISVGIIGLLGVLTLLTRSLALTKVVNDRFIATYLAAEGIEIVRNLADINITTDPPGPSSRQVWDRFLNDGYYELDYTTVFHPNLAAERLPSSVTRSSTPLSLDLTSLSYSYTSGSGTQPSKFIRTVEIEGLSIVDNGSPGGSRAQELKVVSIVEWPDGEVIVEDHFFDWRSIPVN